MDSTELRKQTAIIRKYYAYAKHPDTSGEPKQLYLDARNFNDKQRDIIADIEGMSSIQSVGPSGAMELLYALAKFINAKYPEEWAAIAQKKRL